MLKSSNKSINKIQQILLFIENKLKSKQVIRVIDLVKVSWEKLRKFKATDNDRYFNCNKFGYFKQDCRMS